MLFAFTRASARPLGTRDTSPNASCSPDVTQQRTRPSHSSVTATLDTQPEHVHVCIYLYLCNISLETCIDVLCRRIHTQLFTGAGQNNVKPHRGSCHLARGRKKYHNYVLFIFSLSIFLYQCSTIVFSCV